MIDIDIARDRIRRKIASTWKPEYRPWHSGTLDYDDIRNTMIGTVIFYLWDNLMSLCGGYASGIVFMSAESGLAELVRRGLDKKQFSFGPLNGISFRLTHLSYTIKKGSQCFEISPDVPFRCRYNTPMRWISLTSKEFADFIYEFDALVPEVTREVDVALVQYKAKCIQYNIIKQSVDSIGKEILEPAGIEWKVSNDFTESSVHVTFSDNVHMPFSRVIPMDRLSEVIRSIPERMGSQLEMPRRKHRMITFPDDDPNSICP